MTEFLSDSFANGVTAHPARILVRLLAAFLFGLGVAFVYTRTRPARDRTVTFPPTLVLLAILIAMVTQVIGDSVARAFSLVGALSIVRFRTVVRDTQDTAFVIFAVVMGMAAGGSNMWVAVVGMAVVSLAAVVMSKTQRASESTGTGTSFLLRVRLGLGHDVATAVDPTLDAHTIDRRLLSIETAKQGMAIDLTSRCATGTQEDT